LPTFKWSEQNSPSYFCTLPTVKWSEHNSPSYFYTLPTVKWSEQNSPSYFCSGEVSVGRTVHCRDFKDSGEKPGLCRGALCRCVDSKFQNDEAIKSQWCKKGFKFQNDVDD
jgi:hypothetical protein